MPYAYGETLIRVRKGPSPVGSDGKVLRDSRGQPIPGPVDRTPVKGCVVTPRQESPQVGGSQQQSRDTVIVGWTVYAPHGTDVRTTDQWEIRGVLCEVTGEPSDWGRSPFTGTQGPMQFAADRVTG